MKYNLLNKEWAISQINNFYTITKKVDIFPPWKKCVKKTFECSVKKENLFDYNFSFVSFLF